MRTSPWLLAALGAVGVGCTGRPVRYTAPDFAANAPARVAVLPFDNQSTDLVGPVLLRKMVISSLAERGYVPADIQSIDEQLRTLGVTDGGQLAAFQISDVGKAVGVDGLVYGTVEKFSYTNLGYLVQRAVRLHLWFVRASTGKRLWEDRGDGLTEDVALQNKAAQRQFVAGMAERTLELALHSPLLPESRIAVARVLASLPSPGAQAPLASNPPPALRIAPYGSQGPVRQGGAPFVIKAGHSQ